MKIINANQPWGAEGTLVDEIFQEDVRRLAASTEARDGQFRFDLIPFCSKVVWRLVASMVGIDGIDDPARVERFQSLVMPVVEGLNIEHYPQEQHNEILTTARECRAVIRAELFETSVARRRR